MECKNILKLKDMLGELTPLTKEKYHIDCPHCGNIIMEDDIVKTDNNEEGCDSCITRCKECGEFYFFDELNKNMLCDECYELLYKKFLIINELS